MCVLQVMKTEWNLMVNEVDVMWGQVYIHAHIHACTHAYMHTCIH